MPESPRLKIIVPGDPIERIIDLEQAPDALFGRDVNCLILVEGKTINSYYELAQLASQDSYRDKGCLEVIVLPLVAGG